MLTLPEWTGQQLERLSALETLNRFGYTFDSHCDSRWRERCRRRVRRQDGPVVQDLPQFTDRTAATRVVKQRALEFGADAVGITTVDDTYVYSQHRIDHRHAIVVAVSMDWEQFEDAPDIRTHEEVWRAYDSAGEVSVCLAQELRRRGYSSRAHTIFDEQLAMIPHARAAGLGELGKHGSLINTELGATFRLGVVTTDTPLIVDVPRDSGIDDFCQRCVLCVNHCPGDAIAHEKVSLRGTTRWVVRTEACVPYMASHEACGICLQVCPWNARAFGGRHRRRFGEIMAHLQPEERTRQLRENLQQPWSLIEAEGQNEGNGRELM